MQQDAIFKPFRVLSYVVLLTMIGSVLYAGYIVLTQWSGIGV